MLKLILSTIALVIALIGSLPLLLAMVIYVAFKPRFRIFFASESGVYESTIPFTILEREGACLNIQSLMDKGVHVRIEFLISRPWRFRLKRLRYKHLVTREGFKIVLLDEEYIEARGTFATVFPFELPQKPEESSFTVILYPSIEAKALGLPNIFGRFNLRSITKSFKIVC